VVLQHHHSDEYSTPETEARLDEYGITGVPTIAFDGNQNKVVGTYPTAAQNYQAYKTIVDAERAGGSNLMLVAYRTTCTAATTTMHFSATVTNQGPTTLTNVDLRFAVYENLGTEKRYVVRDMLPSQYIASLAPGASTTLTGDSVSLTGVNPADLGGIAFVQSRAAPTLAVLQAALAEDRPALRVTPDTMEFRMHPNDPVTSTQTAQIVNCGAGSFTWTAAKDAAWLTAAPLAGSSPANLTVTANRTGLTAGQWYIGHVTVTASAGTLDSPQTITVRLKVLVPGPPAHVSASATPGIIRANGVSTAAIRALVTDAAGITVTNGTTVTFQTNRGDITPATATTTLGAAQATLVSTTTAGVATVVAGAGTVTGTVSVRFVGPPHDVAATASPSTIRANGVSTAIIYAHVTDAVGWPVFDGTVVTYTTDRGTLLSSSAATSNGYAYVTLRSSATPGPAHVTAWSAGISGTVTVGFGGPPQTVRVTVSPASLLADGLATAIVTATVTDQWGDRVVNGTTVVFNSTVGTTTPVSATTVGGVATTVLTGTVPGPATVTATSDGRQGQANVMFYREQIFLPLVTRS
jgi:hypothetical protein